MGGDELFFFLLVFFCDFFFFHMFFVLLDLHFGALGVDTGREVNVTNHGVWKRKEEWFCM